MSHYCKVLKADHSSYAILTLTVLSVRYLGAAWMFGMIVPSAATRQPSAPAAAAPPRCTAEVHNRPALDSGRRRLNNNNWGKISHTNSTYPVYYNEILRTFPVFSILIHFIQKDRKTFLFFLGSLEQF